MPDLPPMPLLNEFMIDRQYSDDYHVTDALPLPTGSVGTNVLLSALARLHLLNYYASKSMGRTPFFVSRIYN